MTDCRLLQEQGDSPSVRPGRQVPDSAGQDEEGEVYPEVERHPGAARRVERQAGAAHGGRGQCPERNGG
jgi:hypothetical protein